MEYITLLQNQLALMNALLSVVYEPALKSKLKDQIILTEALIKALS